MTVTRCDRCGAVYGEKPKVKIGNLNTMGTVLIPCKESTLNVKMTAEYDLCETCMKELCEFLDGGKGEKGF